jgi:hypothetical protein
MVYIDFCHKNGHAEGRCFKKTWEIDNSEKQIERALCKNETAFSARAVEE